MAKNKDKSKSSKEESVDKAKEKLDKFDPRGVQTLFRTLSRNHYNLLRMIDGKASIILTVNSIIISLLMGVIYMAPAEQKEVLQLGSKILLNCGMASMVFALLGMLPHKYISKTKSNPNYLGSLYGNNFSKLTVDEFRTEMRRITNTGNILYDEMTMDLYFLGKTVAWKQRMILISVAFFLIGLVSTSILTLSRGIMIEKLFFG